ncbi:MAG: heavy-metal-associated domain-containing protein [Hydrogenibacillus sp.]|nr:heavy-metal-associated domain-containing protein [Hydrogenibacillus sp.]
MQAVLKIGGMTCGHCVHSVKQALSALDGVEAVHVELDGGRAEVTYDPSRVDIEAMRRAVEEEGYRLLGQEQA